MFICVRVQGLAGVSSTSPPGGNQVDGLPPAPVDTFLRALQRIHYFSGILQYVCSYVIQELMQESFEFEEFLADNYDLVFVAAGT